jgi:aspartate ammonia-lyase
MTSKPPHADVRITIEEKTAYKLESERIESDSLGERNLPSEALFGIHSLRASENFRYSGETLAAFPRLVAWLAQIKMVIAQVNVQHGKLTSHQGRAITAACVELAAGEHSDALIVDVLEGAGGTSLNMNVNEVLTNRALQLMGHAPGQYEFLDPLDHVAYAQSTSDVLLTAAKLSLVEDLEALTDAVSTIARSLRDKELRYSNVLRVARTCLQDCMPMRLGQAFGSYAGLAERLAESLHSHLESLMTLPIGGTGIGSGLGTYPGYKQAVVEKLSAIANRALVSNVNLFDAIQNMDEFAALSATIRTVASSLGKVADDLVLLSSGPRAGLNELRLAPVQAGSSMMPGKVNPVHAMGMTQTAYFVAGMDQSIMLSAANGRLETNDYIPLIIVSLIKSIHACREAVSALDKHCVQTLTVNEEMCEKHLIDSAAVAPVLKQVLGYKRVAALVEKARGRGRTVIEIAIEDEIMTREALNECLREGSVSPG